MVQMMQMMNPVNASGMFGVGTWGSSLSSRKEEEEANVSVRNSNNSNNHLMLSRGAERLVQWIGRVVADFDLCCFSSAQKQDDRDGDEAAEAELLWLKLENGEVLCQLVNKIKPDTIKNVNSSVSVHSQPAHVMENFCIYLEALEEILGTSKQEQFDAAVLHNNLCNLFNLLHLCNNENDDNDKVIGRRRTRVSVLRELLRSVRALQVLAAHDNYKVVVAKREAPQVPIKRKKNTNDAITPITESKTEIGPVAGPAQDCMKEEVISVASNADLGKGKGGVIEEKEARNNHPAECGHGALALVAAPVIIPAAASVTVADVDDVDGVDDDGVDRQMARLKRQMKEEAGRKQALPVQSWVVHSPICRTTDCNSSSRGSREWVSALASKEAEIAQSPLPSRRVAVGEEKEEDQVFSEEKAPSANIVKFADDAIAVIANIATVPTVPPTTAASAITILPPFSATSGVLSRPMEEKDNTIVMYLVPEKDDELLPQAMREELAKTKKELAQTSERLHALEELQGLRPEAEKEEHKKKNTWASRLKAMVRRGRGRTEDEEEDGVPFRKPQQPKSKKPKKPKYPSYSFTFGAPLD